MARTRLALLAGQLLIRNREGNAKSRRRELTVGDAIGKHLDREVLSSTDRFFAELAVTHHSRKLENFRDPAAVFLPVQVDCQIHSFMIFLRAGMVTSRGRIETGLLNSWARSNYVRNFITSVIFFSPRQASR